MAAFFARRYAEVVEVQRGDEAPACFLWRGRLYAVRTVLAHWIRTGAWWEQVAATRLASGDPPDASGAGPGMPRWGQRAWGDGPTQGGGPAPDVGVVVMPGDVDDDEREFWRVEASTGRSAIPIVVELCCATSTATWTVSAVMD